MFEVGREDRTVDDVAQIDDERGRVHDPQRRLGYQERQHRKLGGAREDEHAHRDRLDRGQARAHHRHAGDDPPGHYADEERGRGERAVAKRGYLLALKLHELKKGRAVAALRLLPIRRYFFFRFPYSIAMNFSGGRKPFPQTSSYFAVGLEAITCSAVLPALICARMFPETAASMSR